MTKRYIYGIGLIGEETADNNYLTYNYDFRGSTTFITDTEGNTVAEFEYDTYGELLTDPKGYRFLYNGRDGVQTDNNGLYYMRARYYNPEIKRFINQDILLGSIADSTSLNRYSYVNGNPVNLIDPFGLEAQSSGTYNLGQQITHNVVTAGTHLIFMYLIMSEFLSPSEFVSTPKVPTTKISTKTTKETTPMAGDNTGSILRLNTPQQMSRNAAFR